MKVLEKVGSGSSKKTQEEGINRDQPSSRSEGPKGHQHSRSHGSSGRQPNGGGNPRRTNFCDYLPPEALQAGLKQGHLFRARFRQNASDRREAFCTIEGLPHDLVIKGEGYQNRAVEGDVVAIEPMVVEFWFEKRDHAKRAEAPSTSGCLNPTDDAVAALLQRVQISQQQESSQFTGRPWLSCHDPASVLEVMNGILKKKPSLRVTGQVVAILEKTIRRENVIGVVLRPKGMPYLLHPLDPRFPKCFVPEEELKKCGDNLADEAVAKKVECRTLVSARISDWPREYPYPTVSLRKSIGQTGQIESGTAAILAQENIRCEDFPLDVYASLPKLPYKVTDQHVATRRDLRSTRIFTIDPVTARDLDDALSIEPLANGNFQMGVHIADVAFFVPPAGAIDQEAALRGTSVYLVDRVIPMLPRALCEHLCSLNAGEDKFAFSIIWEMTPEGEILHQWSGRTLIRSCAKLAYPMVQAMIEGTFNQEDWKGVTLYDDVTWEQLMGDSLQLWAIAKCLRKKRFDSGALRLDNVRLCYDLDDHGNPISFSHYKQREANQLVEEFMLLANMSVAKFIAEAFPDRAVLRRHDGPNARKLKELEELCQASNIPIDTSSSGALQQSLERLRSDYQGDPVLTEVVTLLTTKPMVLAQYFCTGMYEDKETWRHYALAIDMYTHFTSPIRRYPDVMVHRLLAAALELRDREQGAGEVPEKIRAEIIACHHLPDVTEVTKITSHANETRLSARVVQEASLKLYLCILLQKYPMVLEAMVIGVGGDKFFTVYLPEFGCEHVMYLDQTDVPCTANFSKDVKVLTIDRVADGQEGVTAAQTNSKPDFSTTSWLKGLQALRNPKQLSPVKLPLQLSLFSRVPIIVGAHISDRTGHPVGIAGKLYIEDVGPSPEGVLESVLPDLEGTHLSVVADNLDI